MQEKLNLLEKSKWQEFPDFLLKSSLMDISCSDNRQCRVMLSVMAISKIYLLTAYGKCCFVLMVI
jgi:hypothetical protein